MLALAGLFGQGVAWPWIQALMDCAGNQIGNQIGQFRDLLKAPAAGASPAAALLEKLPVKGPAPKTGYQRSQFGPAWSDDVPVSGGRNGCDQRNDVLRRDLSGVVLKPGTHGCVVLSGTLVDPYSGKRIAFHRGGLGSSAVQIDHVVSLSGAWQSGAQQLTIDQRRALAEDPLNLWAVDGPTNESKGDGDTATWLPPNKAARCSYVARQIGVKARYRLWVTSAEKQAMQRVLSNCPEQEIPAAAVPALQSQR